MSDYWGYHYTLDIAGCDKEKITDYDNLYAFTKELVEKIDMVAYGEPQIVHFAKHDPTKAGYTIVQLIETSNITAHFVDASGEGYIDVFSCKPFDREVVRDLVHKYFEPHSNRENFFFRKA